MAQMPTDPHSGIIWFSDHFGIDLPQYELDFVDFDLNADVPVYIDPFAITKDSTDLAAHCHNAIVSFFHTLMKSIRAGERTQLRRLLEGKLSEPNEIHLGVSQAARTGRGLGRNQTQQLVDAIAASDAAKVGVIQTIAELHLHIDGIGADKISDLVANIILDKLAQYTEWVCTHYGVPTRPCAVNHFWNEVNEQWDAGYFNLPVRGSHSYILVPKRFVRRDRDLISHKRFYDHYILEFLQREMLSANDSLVETLKNGKRRVTKKSLKEDKRYPSSKDFISDFIIQNEAEIESYRQELLSTYKPIDPAYYSGKFREDDPDIKVALEQLDSIPSGRKTANDYHAVVLQLVKFIFDIPLVNFDSEYRMDGGRGRIDVIADNRASGGIFMDLKTQLNANSIPIECKNYSTDLGNNEFNQMVDRLGGKSSRFGIIFCRTIDNEISMMQHQTDRWLRQEIKILLIDDLCLLELVQWRLNREFELIEQSLRRAIRAIEYGNTG